MVIIRGVGQPVPERASGVPPQVTSQDAATAANRVSVASGSPLSARQLAARHDISRRQAGQVVAAVAREANGHG
jgi:hypothetical protein